MKSLAKRRRNVSQEVPPLLETGPICIGRHQRASSMASASVSGSCPDLMPADGDHPDGLSRLGQLNFVGHGELHAANGAVNRVGHAIHSLAIARAALTACNS